MQNSSYKARAAVGVAPMCAHNGAGEQAHAGQPDAAAAVRREQAFRGTLRQGARGRLRHAARRCVTREENAHALQLQVPHISVLHSYPAFTLCFPVYRRTCSDCLEFRAAWTQVQQPTAWTAMNNPRSDGHVSCRMQRPARGWESSQRWRPPRARKSSRRRREWRPDLACLTVMLL